MTYGNDPSHKPAHQVGIARRSDAERRQAIVFAHARQFQTEPTKRPYGSWRVFLAIACVVCAAMGAAIWMSTRLHPDPAIRNVALFVHLACVILGFGAVLAADYFIVLWLARRATLADAVHTATRLHWPIWAGLAGLVLSGMLLEPDVSAATTCAKLAFVVVAVLNGLQAETLGRRIKASTGPLSMRLLGWSAVTTVVSQVCWWGSVWIGFLNSIRGR